MLLIPRWLVWCSSVILLVMPISTIAHAEVDEVWESAESIRKALFHGQASLLDDDITEAEAQLTVAQAAYEQHLRPRLMADLLEKVAQLDADFEAAQVGIGAGDVLAFALIRGRIWTGILGASAEMVVKEIERDNGRAALSWLLVREFRPSTSLSRPHTDATQEVYALIGGRSEVKDVRAVVWAELLDTYQAKLNEALFEADRAEERGFSVRRAEEIGSAAGYFEILAAVYAQQYGEEALTQVRAAFALLTQDGMSGDSTHYLSARRTLDSLLRGFVAAPLTDVELSRRAGELLRFLSLVSIEYSEGIRDGNIVNDLEYHEALIFHDRARNTFADLKPALEQRRGIPLDEVDDLFSQLRTLLDTLGDPDAVQNITYRIASTVGGVLPAEWRTINSTADIQAIRLILNRVHEEVRAGLYDEALATCVGVYTILEEGLGQKLLVYRPEVALRLDTLLWYGQPGQPGLAALLATGAPVITIENVLLRLELALDEAELALIAKNAPASVVGNSTLIVFREGLEAIVILAALLASLHGEKARAFRRWMLRGAALAGVAAVITWGLASGLLQSFVGRGAELEAVVSLLAVGVMLGATNWFLHRRYWTDRLAHFHTRKAALLRFGQGAGWLVFGFACVYREGFEMVLFLQPFGLNSDGGTVFLGVILGLIGVLVVGGTVFALQVRLPYKRMLVITGILMSVVLLGMVGSTVYALQIVGWLDISPMWGVYVPAWAGQWLGLYATWEGIGWQLAALALIIGSYWWVERRQRHKREAVVQVQNMPEAILEG